MNMKETMKATLRFKNFEDRSNVRDGAGSGMSVQSSHRFSNKINIQPTLIIASFIRANELEDEILHTEFSDIAEVAEGNIKSIMNGS